MTPLASFQPSTYYFRRALRNETEVDDLALIVRALQREIELCFDFARAHGVSNCYDGDGGLFDLPDEAGELRDAGLLLCVRLENVKQAIREQGLIPPKKHIMRSEALAKGWALVA